MDEAPRRAEATQPEVATTAGTVRGTRESGTAAFRGIPFAAPPVGRLRFAAPHPVEGWDAVRPATGFGPPPPQPDLFGAPSARVGDDWLTLNVWTPRPEPDAGLPVMVWIPGGGYVVGHSGLPEYDGGRLAVRGVVVVTVNYRLGAEGFALFDGAPPNRGLLDQVAALEWVRDNIRGFGGDPDRVTLFGQSAGAGSVAALLAVPRAAGLFRGAIAQSVPGTFFSPALAADVAAACAAGSGLRPIAAEMSAVAPDRLVAAAQAVSDTMGAHAERWGPITLRPIPWAPVVDGDVLVAAPWQALRDGAARDLPLVVGHTRDEHRLFSLIDGVLGQITPDLAETALRTLAPGHDRTDGTDGTDGGSLYRRTYPGATAEELYELVHGDWLFRMPSLHLAEAQLAGGGRAHVYELAWPAPGMGGALGACHGLDVPLVFGNLTSGQTAGLLGDPVPPAALELSEQLGAAWTRFAADGDPGWPGYDLVRRSTRIFDTDARVGAYPEEGSRAIWQDHDFAALALLT